MPIVTIALLFRRPGTRTLDDSERLKWLEYRVGRTFKAVLSCVCGNKCGESSFSPGFAATGRKLTPALLKVSMFVFSTTRAPTPLKTIPLNAADGEPP